MAARQVLHAIFAEVYGDSINPGAELRVAAERSDRLEDLDEDFLRHVLGLVAASEHAKYEPEHPLLVGLYELVERALVVGNEPLDETLFTLFVVVQNVPARKTTPSTVDRSAERREGHTKKDSGKGRRFRREQPTSGRQTRATRRPATTNSASRRFAVRHAA